MVLSRSSISTYAPPRKVGVALGLCILLGFAFLLRYAAADAPIGYQGGDGMRDYLVAVHAVTYGEWPLVGPPASTVGGVPNSPMYYYLLIPVVALSSSVWFVTVWYLLVLGATILGIFEIARRLFGVTAAFISASLVALSPIYLQEAAQFLWQPRLMEPVLVLGIYLLVRGYETRLIRFFMGSVCAFCAALALHLSVLPLMPLYAVLIGILAYRAGGRRAVLVVGAVLIGVLFVLFLSAAIGFYEQTHSLWPAAQTGGPEGTRSPGEQLVLIMQLLLVRFFPWPLGFAGTLFLCGTIASGIGLYVLAERIPRERKVALAVVTGAVAIQSLAVFALELEVTSRYLAPVFFLWALVIGTLVYELLLRERRMRVIGCLVIVAAVTAFFNDRYVSAALANVGTYDRPRTVAIGEAADAVASRVQALRIQNQYADYGFFDIIGYRTGDYDIKSAVLFAPLEEELQTRLVHERKWGDGVGYYRQSSGEYLFIFCSATSADSPPYPPEACLRAFSRTHADYGPAEPVYESLVLNVFLARRSS